MVAWFRSARPSEKEVHGSIRMQQSCCTSLPPLLFSPTLMVGVKYVADLCCPGGQQPHGQYDRLQRLCGRHDWLRVQHCTPLRCASEPARHATEADGSMRTTAAQVGGSRTADTTGRSGFAADTTGRECSDTTDCTPLRYASAPARGLWPRQMDRCAQMLPRWAAATRLRVLLPQASRL